MAHRSEEDRQTDDAFRKVWPELEQTVEEALENLRVAVGYLGPDGTQKLCGDRCMMHIEDGEYKDRCTIHGDVEVPNEASCRHYMKGKAASPEHEPMKVLTPEMSGLVYGKVLCKNCVRANEDSSVCLPLTDVLQKVLGFDAEFKIAPMGCCDWNRVEGQTVPGEAKAKTA